MKLLKILVADGDLDHLTNRAWRAISIANDPPVLYRHGGRVARIERHDDGNPAISVVGHDRLRYRSAEVTFWFQYKAGDDGKEKEQQVHPPIGVIRNMLACPVIPLPAIEGIVGSPVFASDGSLEINPGYSAKTRTYYQPPAGFELPALPKKPSLKDLAKAKELLLENLLFNFPFSDDAARAHAVVALLLPFVRNLIQGPTPLIAFDKPAPGTGATLLTSSLIYIATGRLAASMTLDGSDEETRKKITATLLGGPAVVLLDNIRHRLDSAALSSVLTATYWEDRVLGVSEMIRLPVKCLWLATGNNFGLSDEMSRRTIWVRLDAKVEKPWERPQKEFRHPNLPQWITENRPQLVHSCLVLASAWVAEGKPRGSESLGMYEDWAGVMGGILGVAEIPGFLGNLSELYEVADEESATWVRFCEVWWAAFGEVPVSTAQLYELGEQNLESDFFDLGTDSDRSQKTRLGKLLSRMRDRHYGDYVITKAGSYQRAQRWKLARGSR